MNNRATKPRYSKSVEADDAGRGEGAAEYLINVPPPQEGDRILWPELYLPFLLLRLTNGITRTTTPLMDRYFALSMREWRVILIVAAMPGITGNEVADMLNSDKMIVSRAVSDLKRKGLLQRKSDRSDRRRSHLQLTAAGRRKYRQIVSLAREYDKALRSAMNLAELRTLESVLAKLDTRMRAIRFDR